LALLVSFCESSVTRSKTTMEDVSSIDLSGEVKQEQSKKMEDITDALIESQKRLSVLETINQTLREKITELENGQKTA